MRGARVQDAARPVRHSSDGTLAHFRMLAMRLRPGASALLLLCLGIGCSGPTGPKQDGSENLSGLWSGTQTVLRAGECPIEGGDSASYPVAMTWAVNRGGEVAIQDLYYSYAWSGSVEPDLDVSLQKVSLANCNGTVETRTFFYHGSVRQESGIYRLNMESVEGWCPEQGCVFRVSVSLTK